VTPSAAAFNDQDGKSGSPEQGPYNGQKAPAIRVYFPKIYGFRVSERAKSGPRMLWLRLRPETAAELDMVDWRGQWIGSDEEYDDDNVESGPKQTGKFDPVSSMV
jgi:casein kinase II subunit beta